VRLAAFLDAAGRAAGAAAAGAAAAAGSNGNLRQAARTADSDLQMTSTNRDPEIPTSFIFFAKIDLRTA